MPSASPTAMPSTVRGIRSSCTIVEACESSGLNSTESTSPGGMYRLPTAIENSATTPSSATARSSPMTLRRPVVATHFGTSG